MDMELSKYINVDLNWNIEKKGRRNTTRRPRKPGVDLGTTKIQDPAAFETKKILDAPSKKRRVLHQSPSPPSLETSCLPPGPQTPSIHYEDPSQRCYNSSLSQTKKTKSKTRLRKSNISKPTKMADFSGLHLLADVACSTFLVDHLSESKEETTPEVNPSTVDIKETKIISMESDGTEEEKITLLKGLRLHWDLNTVPDEWEAPSDDKMLVEPLSPQKSSEDVKSNENENADVSIVPVSGSCNGESFEKTSELTEELTSSQEVMETKINTKTSECESCGSKSEDVAAVSEEISQPVCESPNYSSDKKSSSEECGSNVTTQDEQEGGQIGEEEDTIDKVEVGYDSPFEDGELREPKKETVCYESDNNTCKDDLGTIENEEKVVDHGQTLPDQSSLLVKEAVPNNDVVVKVEESDCGSEKEFTETKNAHQLSKNVTRNYGNSYSRSWRDSKSSHEYYRPNSYTRDYYTPRDGYRGVQNRRPSPSDRNNGYIPNRYRYHSQEYHDPKPSFYSERKVRCYSPKRRSRSRSRSGSPIAWNFQKRKISEVTQSAGHVSPEPSSNAQIRDKRDSMTWRKPIGYYPTHRLKSDDHFRFTERDSARFSREYKYKDGDGVRKHDGHYEKVTRDAGNSVRR